MSEGKKALYTAQSEEPEEEKAPPELPILYYSDLVLQDDSANEELTFDLDLSDALVIMFTGPRGGGKSMSMAFAIAKALAGGLDVWSNMKVAFRCIDGKGEGNYRDLSTKPLDMQALYSLSGDLSNGLVAIDEIQYYLDARESLTIKHRIMNAVLRQVRKRSLAVLGTTRDLEMLDKRLRIWETDLEIACWDMSKSDASIRKGWLIKWNIYDIAGTWTGRKWHPGQEPTAEYLLDMADRLWRIYNTTEIIDFQETAQPLKEIMAGEQEEVDIDALVEAAMMVLEDSSPVLPQDLWDSIDVKNSKLQAAIRKQLLNGCGVRQIRIQGRFHYTLLPSGVRGVV